MQTGAGKEINRLCSVMEEGGKDVLVSMSRPSNKKKDRQ